MSVEVRNLGFAYGRHEVLRGLTAEARGGRVTALVGPNAAGKSTLMRCIIGALRPGRGEALIGGRPAARLRGRQLARSVAYVPQRATVSASFTVRQVVELGRYALPVDGRRIDDALQRLELMDLADRPYPALSVGQQQRVTLARALAQLEPEGHLVLDEPMSAMDLGHVRHTMGLLRELAAGGVTVLIAMHDLTQAAALADEAWLLEDGVFRVTGPAAEVLVPDQLEAVFGVGFTIARDPAGRDVLVPRTHP